MAGKTATHVGSLKNDPPPSPSRPSNEQPRFRSVYDAVLSVFGWAITSPITKIDSGVDELIDDEARYLAKFGLTLNQDGFFI